MQPKLRAGIRKRCGALPGAASRTLEANILFDTLTVKVNKVTVPGLAAVTVREDTTATYAGMYIGTASAIAGWPVIESFSVSPASQ